MNMYEDFNIPWDAVEKSDDFRVIFYTHMTNLCHPFPQMDPKSSHGPNVVRWLLMFKSKQTYPNKWLNYSIHIYKNTNIYMDTFRNALLCYAMLWYDMIMRYDVEYGMKYDMRYDVIWDYMLWNDVIWNDMMLLSGVPDYFYRNKISSGGDLSHYSSASLY